MWAGGVVMLALAVKKDGSVELLNFEYVVVTVDTSGDHYGIKDVRPKPMIR